VKTWKANVTALKGLGQPVTIETFYDGLNQRIRERSSSAFAPFTDKLIHSSARYDNFNITVGRGDDAICRTFMQTYAETDPFAIAESASVRNGSSVVGGEPCDIFSGSSSIFDVSVCIARDGVPREMNTSITRTKQLLSTMTWSNVVVGPLPDEVFANSGACEHPLRDHDLPACEEAGSVKLDVYRVHGVTEPLSLDDRNAADSLGELLFTHCQFDWWEGKHGGFGMPNTVVSWWQVEVSKAFGQYQACSLNHYTHKNMCDGSQTGNPVGRSVVNGPGWLSDPSSLVNGLGAGRLGLDSGRCAPALLSNPDVGNWYSFPSSGRCADGQPVGTNGCSWGNAQHVRTVNSTCIMEDRGLSGRCRQRIWPDLPDLSESAAIFTKALLANDPARGGCPDISLVGEIVLV